MSESKKTEQKDEPDLVDQAEESLFESDNKARKRKPVDSVSWKASEYILHEKSVSWYFGLVGAAILVGVVLYFANGGITAFAVLVAMTAALAVYASRKPETLQYKLSHDGLDIGDRHYLLEDFRSFSLVQDGGVISITLAPLKRFMPPVSLYYDPQDEKKIIAILASILPHEDTELDFVDRLIRKVRF
ncbi:MAG: hypothetical protein R3313_02545 [Candidatus Saccharimonadales bacterium]|nr:hypothetical protein [Candidatus Saccharimonadales bacterium]